MSSLVNSGNTVAASRRCVVAIVVMNTHTHRHMHRHALTLILVYLVIFRFLFVDTKLVMELASLLAACVGVDCGQRQTKSSQSSSPASSGATQSALNWLGSLCH